MVERTEEDVAGRNFDGETVRMTLRDVDDLSVVAAGDARRVLSSNQRRVREIVIDKLTPLHQHQRPLAALVTGVAAQR